MSTKRRKKLKIHTKIAAIGRVREFRVFALEELSRGFGCVWECRDSGNECLTVKRDRFVAERLLQKNSQEFPGTLTSTSVEKRFQQALKSETGVDMKADRMGRSRSSPKKFWQSSTSS